MSSYILLQEQREEFYIFIELEAKIGSDNAPNGAAMNKVEGKWGPPPKVILIF